MNIVLTTQERLLQEALVSRMEAATTKIISGEMKSVANPLSLITASVAKALTKVEDQSLSNQITLLLVEASATISVNNAIAEQFKNRNEELEAELNEVNERYALLLDETTRPENEEPLTQFLPAEEEPQAIEVTEKDGESNGD